MSSLEAVHEGVRDAVLEAIAEQAAELHDQPDVTVTCPCGTTGPIELMNRCAICEIIFCPACSIDHFGLEEE